MFSAIPSPASYRETPPLENEGMAMLRNLKIKNAGVDRRTCPRRAPRFCAAFTLVELLVCVALIGLLAALLMPALSAAREKVRQISCMNNLKQFGVAVHTYSNDYNESLPNYHTGTFFWTSLLPPYLGMTGGCTIANMSNPKWLKCPSADKLGINLGSPYYPYGYNRYAGDLRASQVDTHPPVQMGQILKPAGRLLMADSWNTGIGTVDELGVARYRHNKGCNILYADGHVSWTEGALLPDDLFKLRE
ncbi:MAG: DUF1559 domain-containing protein [Verrucomicrobiae bacterium]|nr:DUF1559 domain-containing protein [Verrucomicrobiae bacterium]